MLLLDTLKDRSNTTCELCGAVKKLQQYTIAPNLTATSNNTILVCKICLNQVNETVEHNPNYWRCLNRSMWSQHTAVQAMVWRILQKLQDEGWPKNLQEMMFLDDDTLALARATDKHMLESSTILHRDINGVTLKQGDTVVLVKDLKVKGSSLVAKQGTTVKNIRLDRNNDKYIEGKIGNQLIVIVTDFVKKT